MKKDVKYANKLFRKNENFCIYHHNVHNAYYANKQINNACKWNIDNNSIDILTALSVWTHMNYTDAKFYFNEINRVLKNKGKAIISFFYMDGDYKPEMLNEIQKSNYHNSIPKKWIFANQVDSNNNFFHPSWVKSAEEAIGINKEGMDFLLKDTTLKIKKHYPGTWKEVPGIYFQDIIIFEKR